MAIFQAIHGGRRGRGAADYCHDTNLRTPDAPHIVLATRARAVLATFDNKMALAARKLKLNLLPL